MKSNTMLGFFGELLEAIAIFCTTHNLVDVNVSQFTAVS